MTDFFRIRVHFNSGQRPVTIPLDPHEADSPEAARAAFHDICHNYDSREGYTHIKSVALLAGHKRSHTQTFERGRML